MREKIKEILNYWFEDLDDSIPMEISSPQFRKWFGKDDATDRQIRERFEEDYLQAVRGDYSAWEGDARGCLALVILQDQFPRNMYRGKPRSFESDSRALDICLHAVEKGEDEKLQLIKRMFLYMPMMHAESRKIQQMSVQYFSLLVERAQKRSPTNVEFFSFSREYAKKHKAIIDRFGLYPHRNSVLGRPSTKEEEEFLKGPDSSF